MDFIRYLVVAGIIAFVFKLTMSLFGAGVAWLVFTLFGLKNRDPDVVLLEHPKKFVTYGVFLNTTIGVVYAIIIEIVTEWWIYDRGGASWLYRTLSFVWAVSVITGAEAFVGTLLTSCFVTLLLLWFRLGMFAPLLTWFIVGGFALAYYIGRADVIREQMRDMGLRK